MTATDFRKREKADHYADTLLNSLALDHLKLALAALHEGPEPPSLRRRSDVIEAIWKTGFSRERVAETLLSIEASVVTKHCLLSRLNGSADENRKKLERVSKGLEISSPIGPFRVARVASDTRVFSITFEHYVNSAEWIKIDETTKTKVHSVLRHPCVLDMALQDGYALLRYPGFSQGSALSASERVSYERVSSALVDLILSAFELSISCLPVEDAIGWLQAKDSKRVRIVRSDLNPGPGKMVLSSDDEFQSVEDVLISLFSPQMMDVETLRRIVGEAIRSSVATSYVANWIEERVLTRIKFLDVGAEFLFFWHDAPNALRTVHRIMELVARVAYALSSNVVRGAFEIISELPPGGVMTVDLLAGRAKADRAAVRAAAVQAVAAGLLEPVYRIATNDSLLDSPNLWTTNLRQLAIEWRTEGGSLIDGREPQNIEVAFRRVVRGDVDQ